MPTCTCWHGADYCGNSATHHCVGACIHEHIRSADMCAECSDPELPRSCGECSRAGHIVDLTVITVEPLTA